MKKLSHEVQVMMETMPLQWLQTLAKLADNHNFQDFKDLVNRLMEKEKDLVFRIPETNQNLAIEKAFSRGKVAMAGILLLFFEHAGQELDRRVESKKKGA